MSLSKPLFVSFLIGAAVTIGAAVAAGPAPRGAQAPAPSAGDAKVAGSTPRENDFVTRVRRLTYEGKRAGEGYFSPDGKKLVFQSEREPGNPFYQIYQLDLETGETRRISPGMGKTTCSFVRSGTGEILFASTHHDPRSLDLQREELELRASGKERRYAWDYDPEMELWVADAKTLEVRAAHQRPRLRRRSQLLAGRKVDRVLVDAKRLRRRRRCRTRQDARDRSLLLRRDLRHAGRRR